MAAERSAWDAASATLPWRSVLAGQAAAVGPSPTPVASACRAETLSRLPQVPTVAVGAAVAAAGGSDETAFGELAATAMAAVGLGLDGRGCGQKAAASSAGIGYRDVPCMEQAVEVARFLFRAAHPPSLNALTAAAEAGNILRRILWALLCDKQLLLRGAPAGVTGPHLAALAAAHRSHRAAATAPPPPWSWAIGAPSGRHAGACRWRPPRDSAGRLLRFPQVSTFPHWPLLVHRPRPQGGGGLGAPGHRAGLDHHHSGGGRRTLLPGRSGQVRCRPLGSGGGCSGSVGRGGSV